MWCNDGNQWKHYIYRWRGISNCTIKLGIAIIIWLGVLIYLDVAIVKWETIPNQQRFQINNKIEIMLQYVS